VCAFSSVGGVGCVRPDLLNGLASSCQGGTGIAAKDGRERWQVPGQTPAINPGHIPCTQQSAVCADDSQRREISLLELLQL
jgi:hypothetical protein